MPVLKEEVPKKNYCVLSKQAVLSSKEQSKESASKHENGDSNDSSNDIFDDSCNTSPLLPSVRNASCLRFKHTPRVFRTPVRESTILREKEFLMKNRPYLHTNKLLHNESSDISEADPMWLKKKGDEFYIGGDYVSAINAYSEAYEKDNELFQALTNRSACYLHLGEPQRCISDGEEAIQLIQTGLQKRASNAAQLDSIHKKILIRIATAYCQMECGVEKLGHILNRLEAATQNDASETTTSKDTKRLKEIHEGLQWKFQGDNMLAKGKFESAITYYKNAMTKESTLICAKVNCATAYFSQNAFQDCCALCEEILDTFKNTGPFRCNDVPPIGSIPLAGTERRRTIVLATLHKKAEAYFHLKSFEDALEAVEMIKAVNGHNFNKSDQNEIEEMKTTIITERSK